MVYMSQAMKQRVTSVVNLSKKIFHVTFIPTVLYLGY